MDAGNYTLFHSGNVNNTFGTSFMVSKELKKLVLGFTPINERLCSIRMKFRFFNITIICTHAPIEDADEEVKDTFYEKLKHIYDIAPKNDVKIVLGDFNPKIGQEDAFKPTTGNNSAHETSQR
jgi:hypothetical protein